MRTRSRCTNRRAEDIAGAAVLGDARGPWLRRGRDAGLDRAATGPCYMLRRIILLEAAMNRRLRSTPRVLSGSLMLLGLFVLGAPQAQARDVDCELRFDLSGWSVFYKTASGTGTITCDNGTSMPVKISAKG